MKKILFATTLIASLASFVEESSATNRNVVFGGYNYGEDVSYGYFGGATALNGNIEKDGTLLRLAGGFGKYRYSAPSVAGENNSGSVSSTDLMLGYQQNFSMGRAVLYVGGDYANYKLAKPDNQSRVVGGKAGAKTQLELFLNLTKNVVFNNISNYSSVYNSYWSQSFLGYNFDKFSFGPEAAFLGNRSFNQQRFGAKVSDINIGNLNLYVSSGYMKSSGQMGDDGAYGAIGFATKF